MDGRRRPLISGFHNVKESALFNPITMHPRAPETRSIGGHLSVATDIYAFAVTCVEVSRFYVGNLYYVSFLLTYV